MRQTAINSIRRATSRRLLAPVLALTAAAAGCSEFKTHDEPGGVVVYDAGNAGGPDGGIRQNQPVMKGEIAPVYGFNTSKARVEYYYMGEVAQASGKVPVGEMYFFYDEAGKPLYRLSKDGTKLVGWHPVVDVVPTKPGYSPFWRVVKVRVKGSADHKAIDKLIDDPLKKETCQMKANCAEGLECIEQRCTSAIEIGVFKLDGIKSRSTLEASLLTTTKTNTLINCPVTDADAKLLKGVADPDRAFPKIQIWFKRLKAFCYLMEGGKDLFGSGAPALAGGALPAKPLPAYFMRQNLNFGTSTTNLVLPKRNMVLTEHLPGASGYTPLVNELSVIVGKDHTSKDLRSVADVKKQQAAGKVKIQDMGKLHNLVVRGTIPGCASDLDCAGTGGKVDPPLKCSVETGFCSPPFVRLGEECRRDVKECDPKGGPGGTRLACVGLRAREKYFCFHACDSSKQDTNPAKDIDTRCGAIKGFQCFALRQSDPTRPNGVCIQRCNSRTSDKQALWDQCRSATPAGHCDASKPETCCDPKSPKAGQGCCGNGILDWGESCDDGNNTNKDGCNEWCTLSTFDRCDQNSDCKGSGQTCKNPGSGKNNNYCLPTAKPEKDESEDKGKYRPVCMEFDYCWPPDERSDWLGKKEEVK